MSARRASSLSRGIIVALGCIAAVWTIFINGNVVIEYIKDIIIQPSLFMDYLLSNRMTNFATLFFGISFFAIIIRDLVGLKKTLLWILLILSVFAVAAIVFNLFVTGPTISFSSSYTTLFRNITFIIVMIAYTVYAVLGLNNRRRHAFGFFFGVFSALLLLSGAVIQIITNHSQLTFDLFIPDTLVFLSNFFVFKCTLYE